MEISADQGWTGLSCPILSLAYYLLLGFTKFSSQMDLGPAASSALIFCHHTGVPDHKGFCVLVMHSL